jgi:hypothetical protein
MASPSSPAPAELARLLFFLLLIATLTLGAHLWLSSSAERVDLSVRERNADEVKIIAVTPPMLAARKAEESRRTQQSLAGAACVEFSGIAGADIPRAREAFASLKLGDRLVERRVEDISRYWVFIPPARDRRTAEATMAQLRRQNVTDMSIRPDHAISLGVFSSEEGARRFLASLEARGVRGAETGAFVKDVREIAMLIREPDTETVARLALLQREYPNAALRAVPCPQ